MHERVVNGGSRCGYVVIFVKDPQGATCFPAYVGGSWLQL
jgi:hypothetical protein